MIILEAYVLMKEQKRNYLYFGEYPQTIKSSDVAVTDIKDDRGYYLRSDGCYYARVLARPYYCPWIDNSSMEEEKKEFKEIVGGAFYPIGQDHSADSKFKLLPINTADAYRFSNGRLVFPKKEYFFKVEKIVWEVLSEIDGIALLATKDIIDSFSYSYGFGYNKNDHYSSSSSYKDSLIRAWLNGFEHEPYIIGIKGLRGGKGTSFINCAFNSLEQDAIIGTPINNSSSLINRALRSVSLDKVSLLTYSDTINPILGFRSNCGIEPLLAKDTTDFSRATGVMINGGLYATNGEWWLRSAKESHVVSIVNYNGDSNNRGFVEKRCYGVVPAINLDTTKLETIYENEKDESKRIEELKVKALARLKELEKKRKNEKVIEKKEELIVPQKCKRVFDQNVGRKGRLYHDPNYVWHDNTEGSNAPSYSGIRDEENDYYDKNDIIDE